MSAIILTIARLTIRETQRRRIMWVALVMGLLFLLVFGLGYHFILAELEKELARFPQSNDLQVVPNFLVIAGLYVINFLVIVMTALLSAGTISGEIETHTMETLVTKPLYRWQIIVGKWLGIAVMVTLYLLALSGGVALIAFFRSGYTLGNYPAGLLMMWLGALAMLSLSFVGGTRFSTLANGALAFALFSVAFVGGWVEQIGALLRNETAVDIGIASSLIMPADVLWKKAVLYFVPQAGISDNFVGPFVVSSQPNDAMIYYALFYIALLLLLALLSFSYRDL